MKKYWYIAIAVVVVVAIFVLGEIGRNRQMNDPDSSYDTIPQELYEEMMTYWSKKDYGDTFYENKYVRYYGTHGDCVAFCFLGVQSVSRDTYLTVGGSHFYLNRPFMLIVYHDGEFLQIEQAHEKGWVDSAQILSMARHHLDLWRDDALQSLT